LHIFSWVELSGGLRLARKKTSAVITSRVELGSRSYDIAVSDDWAGLVLFARPRLLSNRVLIVSDDQVQQHARAVAAALAPAGFEIAVSILPAGEKQKSLATASILYDQLAVMPADRQTPVIPVGGGVIGDLAGFVAATYARGLPWLMVPTTLLAMVDSSVGGKVGINHPRGKNLIGAFHQPVGVYINTATLVTLPEREFRSGLAEVVKYGVILDADLFAYLETEAESLACRDPKTVGELIARCCRLKASIVQRDEREETGLRAVLNYGHTFAHAFEAVAGYGTWLHGEAVAAGMVCASRLAERLGRIPRELTERQVVLLTRLGLPTEIESWPTTELLAAMQRDKKTMSGHLRFVLPSRLGEAGLVEDVAESDVRQVLDASARSS
jgi:3-dehydroquinate synthase